jgi:transcription initiation factor IIE alpha subunit
MQTRSLQFPFLESLLLPILTPKNINDGVRIFDDDGNEIAAADEIEVDHASIENVIIIADMLFDIFLSVDDCEFVLESGHIKDDGEYVYIDEKLSVIQEAILRDQYGFNGVVLSTDVPSLYKKCIVMEAATNEEIESMEKKSIKINTIHDKILKDTSRFILSFDINVIRRALYALDEATVVLTRKMEVPASKRIDRRFTWTYKLRPLPVEYIFDKITKEKMDDAKKVIELFSENDQLYCCNNCENGQIYTFEVLSRDIIEGGINYTCPQCGNKQLHSMEMEDKRDFVYCFIYSLPSTVISPEKKMEWLSWICNDLDIEYDEEEIFPMIAVQYGEGIPVINEDEVEDGLSLAVLDIEEPGCWKQSTEPKDARLLLLNSCIEEPMTVDGFCIDIDDSYICSSDLDVMEPGDIATEIMKRFILMARCMLVNGNSIFLEMISARSVIEMLLKTVDDNPVVEKIKSAINFLESSGLIIDTGTGMKLTKLGVDRVLLMHENGSLQVPVGYSESILSSAEKFYDSLKDVPVPGINIVPMNSDEIAEMRLRDIMNDIQSGKILSIGNFKERLSRGLSANGGTVDFKSFIISNFR